MRFRMILSCHQAEYRKINSSLFFIQRRKLLSTILLARPRHYVFCQPTANSSFSLNRTQSRMLTMTEDELDLVAILSNN